MHPVVHDWCTESISRGQIDLMLLALMAVGFAVPEESGAGILGDAAALAPTCEPMRTEAFHGQRPALI